MTVVPFSATGTAPEDTSWDWNAAAQNKILGGDGDDWTSYKRAHAWWDGSTGADAEKKGAYKFPHHRQGDDGLEAVWHGVSNAMARLSQANIPESDMKGVFEHLAKHYSQWGKDAPAWDRFVRDHRTWLGKSALAKRGITQLPRNATRAVVMVTQERPGGMPTSEDLALINKRARAPLSAEQVYIVPAQISSEDIDAYFTQMTSKTLAQFAEDATNGVAFCDSHNHDRLPIGRSYYGTVVTVPATGKTSSMQAAQSLAYMLRGLPLSSGLNSNDIIRGIDAGIYYDVSVGFIPEHYWCSVCGLDMLNNYECMHWPGMTYEVKDEGDILCVAQVDARLAEWSLVYEGATPNAGVLGNAMTLKAEREMALGRAKPRFLRFVEDVCRVRILHRYPGISLPGSRLPAPPELETTTSDEEEDMTGSEFIAGVMERGGKELSAANMDRLQAMHDKLQAGHNTLSEGMQLMANFLSEKSAPDNGDNDTPDEEEGAPDAEADAADEAGEAGEDKDDAHPPSSSRSSSSSTRAVPSPNPPESDDGDGDDDSPTRADGAPEEEESDDENAADDEERDEEAAPEEEGSDEEEEGAPERASDGTDGSYGDDGQGDEAMEAWDENDDEQSGSKAKSSSSRALDPQRATPAQRRPSSPVLSAEEQDLLAAGRVYRQTLTSEALRAGRRALGPAWNEGVYATILGRATIGELQQLSANWQEIAKVALSKRGTWIADTNEPGGGHWSSEPTLEGGRQTVARDPADPAGTVAAGGRSRIPHSFQERQSDIVGSPDLYKVGARPRRSGSRS